MHRAIAAEEAGGTDGDGEPVPSGKEVDLSHLRLKPGEQIQGARFCISKSKAKKSKPVNRSNSKSSGVLPPPPTKTKTTTSKQDVKPVQDEFGDFQDGFATSTDFEEDAFGSFGSQTPQLAQDDANQTEEPREEGGQEEGGSEGPEGKQLHAQSGPVDV